MRLRILQEHPGLPDYHAGKFTQDDKRRLAAIMFTDVAGYTELMQHDELLALELLDAQRKIIRPIVLSHNGIEIKTMGDAFLVEFPSVLNAVSAAIEIQGTVSKSNLGTISGRKKFEIRIGIHLGDVVHEDADVYGDAVNVASRIESIAQPGTICVSRQVADEIKNKLVGQVQCLGTFQLKGVPGQVELYCVLPNGKAYDTSLIATHQLSQTSRIAVLPLVNISANPEDEYFVDGLTEEIIVRLSNISGLRVIARTSVMRYKGANKSVHEIAQELNVKTLLAGSVRRVENKVRISVQLIDAASEEDIWVQSFDKELQDVFAIQTQIAREVANSLRVRLKANENDRIENKDTHSMDAYNLYLQGRYYWNKRTPDDLKRAASLFEKATSADPRFALAYTGLSDAYCLLGIYGRLPPKDARSFAIEYSSRAIKLDDRLAEAHASFAHGLYHYEWSWNDSEKEFQKADALNPNYASTHHWYSEYLGSMGRVRRSTR